jgi:hypothetical protein
MIERILSTRARSRTADYETSGSYGGDELGSGEPGAGIFKESMGARNRGGIGLSYRPARLYIGWRNSFL